jgi:hypothetical protein
MEDEALSISIEYVQARTVLLDALSALGNQRDAVVLVGAQAIYLQVGEADLAVPVMTTDGDLTLDPRRLGDLPRITTAMLEGGFQALKQPGAWQGRHGVQIDLMVPEALSGRPGHRGADLGVHGRSAARQTRGLEATLVDREIRTVSSLVPGDTRSLQIAVAGAAALLIAKMVKISERVGTTRLEDKDALDVLRLLRGTETAWLAGQLATLQRDQLAGEVTKEALSELVRRFGLPDALGCEMAARAAWPVVPPAEIKASCAALVGDLIDALGHPPRG